MRGVALGVLAAVSLSLASPVAAPAVPGAGADRRASVLLAAPSNLPALSCVK